MPDVALRTSLTSPAQLRVRWGSAAEQVQLCVDVLRAAPVLGDLLTLSCLTVHATSGGVLVTHRDVTVTLTGSPEAVPVTTSSAGPGLPPYLSEVQVVQVKSIQVAATASARAVAGRSR